MPSRICRHSRPPSMGLIQLGRKIAGFISTQISKNMRFMFIQQMFIQSPSETPNKKNSPSHPVQKHSFCDTSKQFKTSSHPRPHPESIPSAFSSHPSASAVGPSPAWPQAPAPQAPAKLPPQRPDLG